jgi:cysteinyl-tRNA synthetase
MRLFEPINPGQVGIYVCGATVQAPPHVGHVRSGVAFDVLARWLKARDFDVTLIRNVTDIDDKIIHNAGHDDVPYWNLAMRNERAFARAYDALGCMRPTYEPRATGHIPEMVELMQRLIDAGHAYEHDGSVYFDVRSYSAYGSLSGQKIDDMLASADSEALGKRDPRDFAMWKAAKPGDPFWSTPWGPGRPGWHIECSAMATKYLGSKFDIHGGGLDLVFPHHENEIAQSHAAGDEFANYWVHNAWVTTSGEKMSKSLGNSLLVDEVIKRIRPVELRFYLAGAHYRSMLEYSDEAVKEAGVGYRRIEGFLERALTKLGDDSALLVVDGKARPAAFNKAMDEDLGVPGALAVLHDTVRHGNAALAQGGDVRDTFREVLAMTDVLGVNPWAEPWASERGSTAETDLADSLISSLLLQRREARERKDFAAADAIRDTLGALGVSIEDGPDGSRWSVSDGR